MDGSIERGYGGPPIFFKNGVIVDDLLGSLNTSWLRSELMVSLLTVKSNTTLLSPQNMQVMGRIANVLWPYGIQLGISLNFASPTAVGGLITFDPLDLYVIAFWINITEQTFQRVPDFVGYLVKANSEGQLGPLTYNRTLAEGANFFAKALNPHGGVVMFRAFCLQPAQRVVLKGRSRQMLLPNSSKELDVKFGDDVVVPIKYGPIGFQVREPASPLLANLYNTSTAFELQVT
jgi:alpha-glucuronidase